MSQIDLTQPREMPAWLKAPDPEREERLGQYRSSRNIRAEVARRSTARRMEKPMYIKIDPTRPFFVPKSVAVCPKCGEQLVITDWTAWEDGGRVVDGEFTLDCTTAPDDADDSEEAGEWFIWHWSTPYIDWLPVKERVFRFVDSRYRLDTEKL